MQSRTLRKYLGLSASVLLLAGNSAWAAQTLEYSIRWDTKDDRYHVFMRPTTTPKSKSCAIWPNGPKAWSGLLQNATVP